MAWYSDAIRKEVTRHRTLMASHRGVCEHVAVSEAASLFNFFNQPGNATSHFYVRRDGIIEQYVDTKYRAPAQLEGNPTLISVETQGGVNSADTEKWTAQQVESLAQLAAWCNTTHGIPLVPMPDSRPESRGIGYHRLGIDPWRVSGGELWSSSTGKICPGAGKIAQIPQIINRARQLTEGEIDMAIGDDILRELRALQSDFDGFQTLYTGRWTQEVNEAREQAAALAAQLTREIDELQADDAGDDVLAGQRWSQHVEENRAQAASLAEKLDALAAQHPTEPTAPKA